MIDSICIRCLSKIACGGSHTMALDNTGKVYAWGYNHRGQLGDGFNANISTPILINTGAIANRVVISIACGCRHTMALDDTGRVYAWGYNWNCQLGNDYTIQQNTPILINTGAIANKVIVSIACGTYHSMALDNTGNIYAWGNNNYSQLGNGDTTQQNTPILINTGDLVNKVIVSIVCGSFHTIALDNTGHVYTWGYNEQGQLGDGTTFDKNRPILINTGAIANKVIVSIACGTYHSMAIDNTGKVYVWGNNLQGQLGNGSTTQQNTPILINTGAIANKVIVSIVCGNFYTMVLDNTGQVYAWGFNAHGQLGNGDTIQQNTPILINTGAIANKVIVSIVCGANHTMAIDDIGRVYAWGNNSQFQLGLSPNCSTTQQNTSILINTFNYNITKNNATRRNSF